MAQKVFSKDYLVNELDMPWTAIYDEITDTGRWSIHHRCVFRDKDGKFYEAHYSVGATESQYERPWEDDTDVTCDEVVLREVKVTKWIRVGDKA